MSTSPPAVRDVVALLMDVDNHNLVRGQVGTIVERLIENHFEVELAGDDGRTYAPVAVHRDSLLVLYHSLASARSTTSAINELERSASQTNQSCRASDANALDGKWPRDETDEELAAELSKSK